MHPNVHSSNVHNSQTLEGAEMSPDRQMDKEDVFHIYNGILLSYQKERILNICCRMEGLEEIMLSEISQAEKDNYHMVSLIYGT